MLTACMGWSTPLMMSAQPAWVKATTSTGKYSICANRLNGLGELWEGGVHVSGLEVSNVASLVVFDRYVSAA